jgi:hypothetical protein
VASREVDRRIDALLQRLFDGADESSTDRLGSPGDEPLASEPALVVGSRLTP